MKNKKMIKKILALTICAGLILSNFSISAVGVLADNATPLNENIIEKSENELSDNNAQLGSTDDVNKENSSPLVMGESPNDKTILDNKNEEDLNKIADILNAGTLRSSTTSSSGTSNLDDDTIAKIADKVAEILQKKQEEKQKKLSEESKNKKSQEPFLADGNYVINCECLHEKENKFSMANDMFAREVDMSVSGKDTTLKFYVPYPVPAFSHLGTDCTVKNFYLEYNNNKYMAKSDITTKPLKKPRVTNSGFGLDKDKAISMQILEFTLPTEALLSNEIILNAGGYVNVMMNRDVELRIKLMDIPVKGDSMTPLFSIDGKEVRVPLWLINMLKSGQLSLPGFNNNNNNNNNNKNNQASSQSGNNNNNSTTLQDGVYRVNGNILKANGNGLSMANDAIEHTMYVVVKGGKANLILTFKGLALNGMFGYLGYLNYYENMNATTPYKSEVLSVQKSGGTTVSDMYGTNYPENIMFPLPSEAMSSGKVMLQLFVPIMESLSAGNGTQKVILELSVNNLQKMSGDADSFINSKKGGSTNTTANNNTNNTKELKLDDGIYKATVSMIKTDKTSTSMANNSINHIAKVVAKNGKYYLTLCFNPMNVGGKTGYLGKLRYYTPTYTLNNGEITGNLQDAKVDEYHTKDGKNVVDDYGTDYPKMCTVEIIDSAKKDGFVALQVFVPIMDKISKGAGHQNVFAKIDINSVSKTTENDPDFTKNDAPIISSVENNVAAENNMASNTNNVIENDNIKLTEAILDKLSNIGSSPSYAQAPVVNVQAPQSPTQTQPQNQMAYGNPYMMNPYMNPYNMAYINPYMINPYNNASYNNSNMNQIENKDIETNNKKSQNSKSKALVSVVFGGLSGIGAGIGFILKRFL